MKKRSVFISFDGGLAKHMLKVLGFYVHDSGFIFHKKTHRPVKSLTGKPVHESKFAGALKTKRGVRLITADIGDLMAAIDHIS